MVLNIGGRKSHILTILRKSRFWCFKEEISEWKNMGFRLSLKKFNDQYPNHGRMNYKDTKPYMLAFLSVDLLTDFAAFCLTDFIDWRYIHSWFVISTQLVNCCPHGQRNYMVLVYCCPSTVPSLWPPPPSPPSQCTVYCIQTVCDCGEGGCWNVLWTIFCRSFTLCFWPDSEPTKLLHHPK